MRRRIVQGLLVWAMLLMAHPAAAVELTASVDRAHLSLDDQLTLTVTVTGASGRIPQPQLPELSDWTVYSVGRSQNITIVNGQFTSRVVFSYILIPHTVGVKIISPVTIQQNGQVVETDAIQVEVARATSQSLSPRSTPVPSATTQAPTHTPAPTASTHRPLFVKAYVDMLRAYVNQQITLTFEFYQAVELVDNPQYAPPSTTGFWSEDLLPPQRTYYATIDGTRFRVTEIKTALFPTSAGELTIGEARLVASIPQTRSRRHSRDLFDLFFNDPFFRRGEPATLTTDPITVEVLPLPLEGRPKDFQGDVGQFQISASVDQLTVRAGEPITLRVRIAGTGNIKTISQPPAPTLSHVKIYDSGSSEEVFKEGGLVRGEKTFEQVLVPTQAEQLTIPPLEYSFFNPLEKRYRTVKTQAVMVTVEPGVVVHQPSVVGSTQRPIEVVGRDIHYIMTGVEGLENQRHRLYRAAWFWPLHVGWPALYLGAVWIVRRRRRLSDNVGLARQFRALQSARKILNDARQHVSAGDIERFHGSIHRALTSYVGDKLGLAEAGLTAQDVEHHLVKCGVNDTLVGQVRSCLSACDHVRFATGQTDARTMTRTADDVDTLLNKLEKAL